MPGHVVMIISSCSVAIPKVTTLSGIPYVPVETFQCVQIFMDFICQASYPQKQSGKKLPYTSMLAVLSNASPILPFYHSNNQSTDQHAIALLKYLHPVTPVY